MINNKVEYTDLIGELEGFPIEVVQKMVDYQIEQGVEADIQILQSDPKTPNNFGGFDWFSTLEGFDFWNQLIVHKDFNLFFKRNPIETEPKVRDLCIFWREDKSEAIVGRLIEKDKIHSFDKDLKLNQSDKLYYCNENSAFEHAIKFYSVDQYINFIKE